MSKSIFAAMVKAQKAYGPALKRSLNPHFGKKYADLAACIEAVVDALNDNGIALTQTCHESPDGVIVETTLVHESGESWSGGRLFVPAERRDPQKFGSALTYARRYSLSATCGIAPEDDDANAACTTTPQPPRQQSAPASPQKQSPAPPPARTMATTIERIAKCSALEDLATLWAALPVSEKSMEANIKAKDARKAALAAREVA